MTTNTENGRRTQAAETGQPDSPQQLIDAFRSVFGHHHARAAHAKGILLEGRFTPTPEARELSRAALFAGPVVLVLARFSASAGIPDIPDTDDGARPHGFAVKFRLADGSETDVLGHSFNGFPVATGGELGQLFRAIAASGPDVAKPTPLDRFLAIHPIAQAFLTSPKPAPESYATLSYFGVNSFRFVDWQGRGTHLRYRFVPQAGEQFLDGDALKSKGPNYLSEEIASRLAAAPVRFDWLAQISGPGDVIDDPSVAWPETRQLVRLGTIEIIRMIEDQASADKATLFGPVNMLPGIEAADPMLHVRDATYLLSFRDRQ